MLKNYLVITFRNLWRNKIYSFINIVGLSIGLATAMLIMLYTKDEVSYDRFHKNVGQIHRVIINRINPDGSDAFSGGYSGYFQGPKFAANIPEIQTFVRLQSDTKDIKQGGEIKSQELLLVDTNFFAVFSLPLLSGNPKTVLQQPKSVVISEDMARKQFGTANALGQTMMVKNENKFEPYLVTGIAKKTPQNSSIKFDMLLPLIVSPQDEALNDNWFNFFLNTFVVLTPDANIKTVEAKMKNVYEADAKATIKMMAEKYGDKATTTHLLQPMTEMHLSEKYKAENGLSDASNPIFSYILSGVALFILLIACINFVNLTIARSLKRAKEIGVRKVVGGARQQLIRQFLGESFTLCLLAFGLAVLLVELMLPTFNGLSNKALSLSYLFDAKLIAGYFALFLITGLLSGFYPALVLSGYNPVQTLYGRFNLKGKNYLQKSLVVLQFTLASALIMATLTIYSQFNYLTTKNLGYDDSNVVEVKNSGLKQKEAKLFENQLLTNSNILQVAPKNGGMWGTVAKVNSTQEISFAYETVNEAYVPILKIQMVKGRNFSKDFPADSTHSVLVNEAFVEKAGWKNPIGQVVDFWYRDNEKYTVIGVVKDYHFESLASAIKPQLFTMKPSNGFGKVLIKISPNNITASLKHIEKTFKTLFPLQPYVYDFKDTINLKNYESEAKWKQMMLFSAILTIFVSCIGLFGLATLSAEKRIKEIGIRKVMGASVTSITTLLSVDFLKLVTFSFVFAFPIAWYAMQQWLEKYPYRVSMSVWIFAATAAITISIALLTVGWQSVKSALMNPIKSLKTE
ncbi:MAG: ABC transporter permease [Spirosomataceae bacterium]